MSNKPCDCTIVGYSIGHEAIEYCSMHKAAPTLLETLKALALTVCNETCPTVWLTVREQPHSKPCKQIKAAIAKADGCS